MNEKKYGKTTSEIHTVEATEMKKIYELVDKMI